MVRVESPSVIWSMIVVKILASLLFDDALASTGTLSTPFHGFMSAVILKTLVSATMMLSI